MNEEISMEERDEAILHMFAAGRNVDFISDRLGVPVGIVVDMQKQWMKGELVLPVQSAELTKEERNDLIISYRKKGLALKEICGKLDLPYHIVNNVLQRNKVKAPVKVKSKPVKPLREKDITITSILAEKAPKQATGDVVEDKTVNTSWTENDSLKVQILDLNKQLTRFRETEKEIRLEFINFKLDSERKLAAEKAETQKAYADYSLEVENTKRHRKQVEDLLMTDSLNVGLMQQNLMFRDRFGKLQEGERL